MTGGLEREAEERMIARQSATGAGGLAEEGRGGIRGALEYFREGMKGGWEVRTGEERMCNK